MSRRLLIVSNVFVAVVLVGGFLMWFLPPATPTVVKATEQKVETEEARSLSWHEVNNVPWAARDSHTVFVFQDKLWLLGGLSVVGNGEPVSMAQYASAKHYNDIWSSVDGETWHKEIAHAAFPPLRSASIVEYHGVLYLLGGWSPALGYKSGIWKSTDGVTWKLAATSAPWGEREGQKVIVWNDKLWLLGGVNYDKLQLFNDVWSSEDGVNWQAEATINPWKPRWDHDVAIFQNKLWLAGGMAFNGIGYGDVWSSADGKSWHQEVAQAPWGERQGHALETFQNKLWLIGGLSSDTNKADGGTWSSSDGINWERLPAGEAWLPREDLGVAVFLNKLWLLGGMDANWHWTNDLWYLE